MKYFSDKELIHSNTAEMLCIDNTPKDSMIWQNLHTLVEKILDPAREQLGLPIIVNCGYRSEQTNVAVGGAKGSQHTKGMAADIRCKDMAKLGRILRAMDYDQLGIYPTFYHVSYDPTKKRQRHQIFYSK